MALDFPRYDYLVTFMLQRYSYLLRLTLPPGWGIRNIQGGFWITEGSKNRSGGHKITNGSDAHYWIPPSQIRVVEKVHRKPPPSQEEKEHGVWAEIIVPGTVSHSIKDTSFKVPLGLDEIPSEEREWVRKTLQFCYSKIHAVTVGVRLYDECPYCGTMECTEGNCRDPIQDTRF